MTQKSERSCPVCGKSFSKESNEAARNAVVGHMAASTDEQHSGIGYQKAEQKIDLDDAEIEADPEQSTGTPPEAPATDGGSEQSDEQSSEQSNPAFGAPDPDPEQQGSEQSDEQDEGTPCPHCGTVIEGYDDLDAGKAYRCGSCSEPFRVPEGGAAA